MGGGAARAVAGLTLGIADSSVGEPQERRPYRASDLILVMEDGSIVEQGSHEELLETDGAYGRLHRSQFEAPVEDVLA